MANSLNIIIPFYNAAATIERTVRSLDCLSPQYRGQVQVIAVDDGSTDASAEIFLRVLAEVSGINGKLLRKSNGGSASARNMALNCFDTGWTLFLDADDELCQDPLPALDECKGKSSVLCSVEFFRMNQRFDRMCARKISPQKFVQIFTSKCPLVINSVIFRREMLDNLFMEELKFLEDWVFWAINPGIFSKSIVRSEIVLGRINVGEGNKSSDQYNTGFFRKMAAGIIASFWYGRLDAIAKNNLIVQDAIGELQMGNSGNWRCLFLFPISPSLYTKFITYMFFYSAYLKYYPYRD